MNLSDIVLFLPEREKRMTTSLSSKAKLNHGMYKQTNWVIQQMFSSNGNEKREREYAKP